MAEYKINDIYQGGYSSFKSDYGDFVGYRVPNKAIGITTDPRVADVMTEVSQKIAPGGKTVELSLVSPEVFESIPDQHLKEVNRLAKLTGVDITVHAPIVEPSGMSKEGFSEVNREATERQMNLAIKRAHEVSPDGSIPVTFHSSAVLPGKEVVKTKKGEEVKGMIVVNSETGSMHRIKAEEEKYFPGEKKDIQGELDRINEDQWRSALTHLSYNTERANEAINLSNVTAQLAEAEKKAGRELTPEERQLSFRYNAGVNFLNDSYRELKELYNMAYKNVGDEEKKILNDFKNKIQKDVEKINKNPSGRENIELTKKIVEDGVETLNRIPVPRIFKPLDEFSKEKTTTTFANVAFDSYKQFKDKAPIISIENPPVGAAFSRGEELKDIVEESRKKFVERAKKEGMSVSEAEKAAAKMLGVTWDVGHINMLRRYGYEKEDIVKETEQVKKLVKHVHLSDNFGFEHTELPMGMGNVPFKEIMEQLGKEGYEAKKIIEASSWWQHFKSSPVAESMKALGSPIYSMQMAPYWNQAVGLQQGYFGGYGEMLPGIHYETFGAGFSQLPNELGGSRGGGAGSRMGGRGME